MEEEIRDPYEYEVDLRDYITVIWHKKWIIAAVFVIAVGAALAFSLSSTPEYSAEKSLLVVSDLSDQLLDPRNTKSPVNFTSNFNYEEVGLSGRLLEDLSEKGITAEGRTTPDSLKERLSVELSVPDNQEVGEKELNGPVINLRVTGSNRQRVTEIAESWADLYAKRASTIISEETKRYRKLISDKYSATKKELKEKIEERIEAREEYEPQILQTELEVLENKYQTFFSSLESAKLDLEKNKAKLETINSLIEGEPRYLYVESSFPPENPWAGSESPEKSAGKNRENSGAVKVRNQKVNQIFFTLKEKKIDVETEVISLKKEVGYLSTKLEEFKENIYSKRAAIDRAQFELDDLNKDIKHLKATSDSLYSAFEVARRASREGNPIKIMKSSASVKTLNRVNTTQNLAVAGVLGLFIGVLLAFFKNYMEDYEVETD